MCSLYDNIMFQLEMKGVKAGRMLTDLGMSRSFVSNLKNGRVKNLDYSTVKRFADYLGCTTADLYGEEETVQSNKSQSAELLQALHDRPEMKILFENALDLTPEQITLVSCMIEGFKKNDN